ncbi:glycosyltransferase family 2 protein [Acholeplasma vituli]|uniref:Glycosyltransferase family 2 protein n=1 Tax=Paracholeplasma vituli TaxID=69473 RepID=A0ABT2PV01_9MOLU|nr:glycosyltransferase family A protein [Paracholeplasma vituli]MCU0104164.1 glycosyltransferase family 2 protein [Paracholeplasma vituli]
MRLTIFTPTFNRAYILKKLYISLLDQTNLNFVWLIIDDGSTDDTKNLIDMFLNEDKIHIKYIYQKNQGKMQAHNTAVLSCQTEFFFCVDSDDYLVNDSVEKMYKAIDFIENEPKLSGTIFYRGKNNYEIIGNEFPEGIKSISLSDLYRSGFSGDTSLLYKTDVLRNYLFPYIEGEKFIPEDYVYKQIDQVYEMQLVPSILIVTKYLDDGYSNNIGKVIIKNPKSWSLYNLLLSKYEKNLIKKTKYIRIYITFALLGKNKKILKLSNNKILTTLLYPLGYIGYLHKKRLRG